MKEPMIKKRWLKAVLWTLLLASVSLILFKTIFHRPVNNNQPIKLELFWEFRQWINGKGYGKDILMNILLFVPFGIFLGLIRDRWSVIIVGFVFSLSIELLQLIFRIGWFELDDILNNTIGTALGLAIASLINRAIMNIEAKKNHKAFHEKLTQNWCRKL